ncbi:MAG: murein biosynthesis integral membrane protein MurJ [Coriobacteriales bacterium]|nr:murein biosynthesis integral membrane protein MurJ [Coriobacteriales bacterium]
MATPTVARSTALMAGATLASRATGLLRTWVMAYVLGNTLITSAYQIANNMPNLVFDLVAGGLLNAAFVPLYMLAAEKRGKEGGDRYASNLLNIIIVVMGSLSLVAAVFAPQIIATQTFTVGEDAGVTLFAVSFFRLFAIQMLFYGLGGVFTAVLNANRVFFLPAVAPAFNNVVVICSFIAYLFISQNDAMLAIYVLGIGTTLGVAVQFAVQIPALVRQGFKYTPRIDFKDPGLIETIKTGIPMVIYVVGALVSFSFRNAFSLETGQEGPSTLLYAWTWFQLPHGIIAVSLARALFTEMSDAAAREDAAGFKRFLHNGISGTLLLIIPFAALMFVLAAPLMQVFRAGEFNTEDVQYVASVLGFWVLALPAYSLNMYLFNVFAALRKFWIYALICTVSCALQCTLYALLCGKEGIGIIGVPIADFVYYCLTTAILLFVLQRLIGSYRMEDSIRTGLKALGAALAGAVVTGLLIRFLPLGEGMLAGVGMIALYGGLGLVICFALCLLFRVPEMALVKNALRRIAKRSGE